MNLSTMMEMISKFKVLVVDSGFIRDVQEYMKTISQPQNNQNLVLLKDVAQKIQNSLTKIYESDLSDILNILIPADQENIFTNTNHLENINKLIADPQINTPQFFQQLNQTLNSINAQVTNNQNIITQLENVLTPYFKAQTKKFKTAERAIISLVFKNNNTITHLKKFSNSLLRWNKAIYFYNQLVSQKSPTDIELVNVQNGSLDVILNIDLNVAVNLNEIIKYGLQAFSAYLIYKVSVQKIVKAYFGNKKLIESEKERETELLKNIGDVIENKISEQHKKITHENKNIKPDNPTKMISEVSKTITEHLVSGNEIKLLVKADDEKTQNELDETIKESLSVRNDLKKLSDEEKKLLIEYYELKEEITEDKK